MSQPATGFISRPPIDSRRPVVATSAKLHTSREASGMAMASGDGRTAGRAAARVAGVDRSVSDPARVATVVVMPAIIVPFALREPCVPDLVADSSQRVLKFGKKVPII